MKNFFKVFSLVLVLTTMFTFTSCKKDAKDLIVGKWNLTSAEASDPEAAMEMKMMLNKTTFEFTESGSMTISVSTGIPQMGDFKITASYTVDGDQLNIIMPDMEDIDPDRGLATIKEITKKKMTLYSTDGKDEITLGFDKI